MRGEVVATRLPPETKEILRAAGEAQGFDSLGRTLAALCTELIHDVDLLEKLMLKAKVRRGSR